MTMSNLGGLKFLEKQHCLVLGVSYYCAMAATRARIRSAGERAAAWLSAR